MRNMYLYLAVVLTLSMFSIARAQEVADSVGSHYELDEVVVEGRTQKVVKNGVEYIPGKKMKKSSVDAFNLLFNMQIPQLSVSPVDNSIKSVGGQDAGLFIDYIPATQQDLQSLRPEDVARVEVLEYPQDPRFNSAPHVVNFIMRKYEWGGYTKLTAVGRTLSNDYISGSVYEKFNYKKWTFDASASANGQWDKTYKSNQSELYKDFMLAGTRYDNMTRTSSTDDYFFKTDGQMATLRAAWSGNAAYISHSASFSRSGNPTTRSNLNVSFSDPILPSTEAVDVANAQSISCAVNGYYYFVLPKGSSLIADWSFKHSGNNAASVYTLGNLTPIINANRERTYTPELSLYYSKTLGHNNTLRGIVTNYTDFYHTDYTGSFAQRQNLTTSQSTVTIEYMQYWRSGISLYARAGAFYTYGYLNGADFMHEWSPRLGLNVQYQINSKNIVGFEGWWNSSMPSAFTANNAVVRDNELLWIQGNPDLKNIYGPMLTASYTLIPTNKFSMTAVFKYNRYANMPVYVFNREAGYDGIVRTFSDDNNEQEISGLLSASLKLFNNSLNLSATGEVRREIYTGIHPIRQTCLYGYAQASYFVRNFSFTLYYSSPTKRIFNTEGFVKRRPQTYGLNASYALGDFKAVLSFTNWFGNSYGRNEYYSPCYNSDLSYLMSGFSRGLNLTLSYTIPYGKKVDRSDEVQNEATKKSAILE